MLIFFRVVQGATGGALQPLSQAVMLEAFPPHGSRQGDGVLGARHRGRAHARPGDRRLADRQFQLALGLLHQSAGGAGVGHHDAAVHLRSALHRRGRSAASITGASACSPLGVGALQVVLDKGQEEDWFAANWIVVLAIVVSLAALVLFVVHELHTREPGGAPARLQGPHVLPPASS